MWIDVLREERKGKGGEQAECRRAEVGRNLCGFAEADLDATIVNSAS